MAEKNHLVRNNFGGSFGGPIARKKTFFFFNYEGCDRQSIETMVATVPTADEINGNFEISGADDLQSVQRASQSEFRSVETRKPG